MVNKKELGNKGENIAENFLKTKGYEILERNFRTRKAEIDIIAMQNKEIVFVEVKLRKVLECGKPAEAINENKKKHLYNGAEYYLYKNNMMDRFCRFDVIEVYVINNYCKVIHLKNVEINY